ncbi:unnamed protein product [Lampetra fluviatilis]
MGDGRGETGGQGMPLWDEREEGEKSSEGAESMGRQGKGPIDNESMEEPPKPAVTDWAEVVEAGEEGEERQKAGIRREKFERVTFLGPRDAWRKAQARLRGMYIIDVIGAYQWLELWTGVKHPRFDGITIDNSPEMRQRLDEEGAAICNDDADVAAMNAHVDDDDVNNDVAKSPASSTRYDLVHAAVLPKLSLLSGGINLALQALSDIIQPDEKNAGDRDPPPIMVVSRGEDLIIESLFLLVKGLPKGSLNKKFLHHLFLYYDGRFEDPLFIATTFNQLQRHACVRQTAHIGAKRASQLQKLGELPIRRRSDNACSG